MCGSSLRAQSILYWTWNWIFCPYFGLRGKTFVLYRRAQWKSNVENQDVLISWLCKELEVRDKLEYYVRVCERVRGLLGSASCKFHHHWVLDRCRCVWNHSSCVLDAFQTCAEVFCGLLPSLTTPLGVISQIKTKRKTSHHSEEFLERLHFNGLDIMKWFPEPGMITSLFSCQKAKRWGLKKAACWHLQHKQWHLLADTLINSSMWQNSWWTMYTEEHFISAGLK